MPEILCVKAQDVPQPLIRQHTSACVSIQAQDVPQSVIYGNTVFKALSVKARLIHLNCLEDQDVVVCTPALDTSAYVSLKTYPRPL
jgi:hypothetical protein